LTTALGLKRQSSAPTLWLFNKPLSPWEELASVCESECDKQRLVFSDRACSKEVNFRLVLVAWSHRKRTPTYVTRLPKACWGPIWVISHQWEIVWIPKLNSPRYPSTVYMQRVKMFCYCLKNSVVCRRHECMVIQKETVVIFFFHFMNKFVFCVTVIAVYGRSYYLLLLIKSFIPSKLQHCVLPILSHSVCIRIFGQRIQIELFGLVSWKFSVLHLKCRPDNIVTGDDSDYDRTSIAVSHVVRICAVCDSRDACITTQRNP